MSHIGKKSVLTKDSVSKYEWKLLQLKQSVIEYVHENAALCDELTEVQEELIIRHEERKYLLRKLCLHEPLVEQEVEKLSKILYNSQTSEGNKNESSGNSSTKKSIKRKQSNSSTTTDNAIIATQNNQAKVPSSSLSNNNKPKKPALKPRKKIIQPMILDTFGRTVFPIELGSLTIHYLGEVICESEFHTEDVIYPVGFVSTKIYGSIQDPTMKCIYTCKISDSNGNPSFEISSDENTPTILGATPNICHSMLLQKVNDVLNVNVVSTKPRGNEFFGLSHPTVLHLVQGSSKARKCANYKWTKFEVLKNNDAPLEEAEASLNFDVLQRNITYYTLRIAPNVLEKPEDFI